MGAIECFESRGIYYTAHKGAESSSLPARQDLINDLIAGTKVKPDAEESERNSSDKSSPVLTGHYDPAQLKKWFNLMSGATPHRTQ